MVSTDDDPLFDEDTSTHPFDRISTTQRRYSSIAPSGALRTLLSPPEENVLRTLAELSPMLDTAATTSALAERFVKMVSPLFPERRVEVVLVDTTSVGASTLRFGLARGIEDVESTLVSRAAMHARGLERASLERAGFIVSPEPVALGDALRVGMERLLADAAKTIGLLVVEHEGDVSISPVDLIRLDAFADVLERAIVSFMARRDTATLRRVVRGLAAPRPTPLAIFERDGRQRTQSEAWTELFESLDARSTRERLDAAIARVVSSGEKVVRVDLRATGVNAPTNVACDVVDVGEHVVVVVRDLAAVRELEARVAHAEKLASLGQFVASIVHELNNPLTAIGTNAELLERSFEQAPREGDTRTKLGRILDAAARMQRFTRDVISYAKPTTGTAEAVDVSLLLRRARAACEHIAARADVTLILVDDSGRGQIWGVRDQLEQVLVNLVTNACHASTSGGRVTLRASAPGNGLVELRVEDDGPGVPEAMRDDVFRPFFTTKRDGHGTGLGLAIVRNIVERHAGRIRVESTSATGGTLFVVTLPASPYVSAE